MNHRIKLCNAQKSNEKHFYILLYNFFVRLLLLWDNGTTGCPDGFEGDNCAEQVNTKFLGTYQVEMYGQLNGTIGGLATLTLDAGTEQNPKTTTATITQGPNDGPDEVRINVVLPLEASGSIDSDFNIPVEIVGKFEIVQNTIYPRQALDSALMLSEFLRQLILALV